MLLVVVSGPAATAVVLRTLLVVSVRAMVVLPAARPALVSGPAAAAPAARVVLLVGADATAAPAVRVALLVMSADLAINCATHIRSSDGRKIAAMKSVKSHRGIGSKNLNLRIFLPC